VTGTYDELIGQDPKTWNASAINKIMRWDILQDAKEGRSIKEILIDRSVPRKTYDEWRRRYPDWKRDMDAAFAAAVGNDPRYDGSFVSFRRHFLNTKTPGFQAAVANEIETAEPGEVTMILMPPEHGKTTMLEDWCTYKLCTDYSFRITVASANVEHPKKVLARVRGRIDHDSPFEELVGRFGPFAPDNARSSQVWGQIQFDIRQRRLDDERDYSMKAIGVTGSVQGTRCDLLLIDDVQSLRNLDQTEKIFETIRQDFLSRPSVFGRTVIIGTRVGQFDVYRRLIDEDVVDRLVTFPAYDVAESPTWERPEDKPKRNKPETHPPEGVKFLWSERYNPYQYAALRYRVGENAWQRNYMQHPEAATSMTFDAETLEAMRDLDRSVVHDPKPFDDGTPVPVIISVDPAIGGGNGTVAAAMYSDRLEVLHCRLDYDLTQYSQIIDLVEEYCHRYSTPTSFVTTVVVEDRAFQKGLLQDDRLAEVQQRFDLRIVPNTTGREKSDSDIGVPSMPLPMQRHQITVPWADQRSIDVMFPLVDHLGIWRPHSDPAKLPQDMTMALWFAFRQWRAVRDTPVKRRQGNIDSWATKASPLRGHRRRMRRPTKPYRSLSTYRGRP
jgi:hypothetical protein